MRPIQPLLLGLFLALVIVYFRRFRTRLSDRAIIGLLAISGVTLICYPELAVAAAHLLGVGRGVDLLLYVGYLVVGYALLVQYSGLRRLNQRLTELTREIAVEVGLQQSNPAAKIRHEGRESPVD
jgi:small membrane protein